MYILNHLRGGTWNEVEKQKKEEIIATDLASHDSVAVCLHGTWGPREPMPRWMLRTMILLAFFLNPLLDFLFYRAKAATYLVGREV